MVMADQTVARVNVVEEVMSPATEQRTKETHVLGMSIDPNQVTIDNLEKYENLMKGKGAKASSNANY